MVANGEMVTEAGQPSWPAPDDPAFTGADEQTQEWLKQTQPEALADNLTDTVKNAFHALSALAMFHGAYPQEALNNALAQLPTERAELLGEQLELSKTYAQGRNAARDTDARLEDHLYELSMKAATLKHSNEQSTS